MYTFYENYIPQIRMCAYVCLSIHTFSLYRLFLICLRSDYVCTYLFIYIYIYIYIYISHY